MSCHVCGQVFLYAAEIGDFLEVAVHFPSMTDTSCKGTLLASVTVVPKVCLATCVVRFFFMPQKSAISLR